MGSVNASEEYCFQKEGGLFYTRCEIFFLSSKNSQSPLGNSHTGLETSWRLSGQENLHEEDIISLEVARKYVNDYAWKILN